MCERLFAIFFLCIVLYNPVTNAAANGKVHDKSMSTSLRRTDRPGSLEILEVPEKPTLLLWNGKSPIITILERLGDRIWDDNVHAVKLREIFDIVYQNYIEKQITFRTEVGLRGKALSYVADFKDNTKSTQIFHKFLSQFKSNMYSRCADVLMYFCGGNDNDKRIPIANMDRDFFASKLEGINSNIKEPASLKLKRLKCGESFREFLTGCIQGGIGAINETRYHTCRYKKNKRKLYLSKKEALGILIQESSYNTPYSSLYILSVTRDSRNFTQNNIGSIITHVNNHRLSIETPHEDFVEAIRQEREDESIPFLTLTLRDAVPTERRDTTENEQCNTAYTQSTRWINDVYGYMTGILNQVLQKEI